MKKMFLCLWWGSYTNQISVEEENFFDRERGYTDDMQYDIMKLNVGQSIQMDVEHTVLRLPDNYKISTVNVDMDIVLEK